MKHQLLKLMILFMVLFGVSQSPVQRTAQAQAQFCELALVLAMDASSSVDDAEYLLQMKGMASALLDKEVQDAIGTMGGMYLAAFEWNGRLKQKVIFDWVYLETGQDAHHLAAILARHVRNTTNAPTALGAALGYAHRMLERVPVRCARTVIDVAGDGHSNDGIKPSDVYALYDFGNTQVNGLVIKDFYRNPETFYRDPETYYKDHVIRGSGAFLELAHTFDDFERAMKRKLLREIVPGAVGMLDQ